MIRPLFSRWDAKPLRELCVAGTERALEIAPERLQCSQGRQTGSFRAQDA